MGGCCRASQLLSLFEMSAPPLPLTLSPPQVRILIGQMREPSIACFIVWTFLSNLGAWVPRRLCTLRCPLPVMWPPRSLAGTFIASFPLVPFTEVKHGFSVEEVGL